MSDVECGCLIVGIVFMLIDKAVLSPLAMEGYFIRLGIGIVLMTILSMINY